MATYLPLFVKQLDGTQYQGLNCTCASGAMALDRETLGRSTTNANRVRQLTGDKVGGTRLTQVDAALFKGWQVDLATFTPTTLATFDKRIDRGEGAVIQGASKATRGTKWSASETFGGNHAWFCNERRRNSQVAGGWEYRIYDPLGDGRRAKIANFGPHGLWIPRSLTLQFTSGLNVAADPIHHYVPLGGGKIYGSFTRDTEPHLTLRFGAKALVPPRRRIAKAPSGRKVNVRSAPATTAMIVAKLNTGDVFIAYQRTDKGQKLAGSRRWYGNLTGTRWVHTSGLRVP